MVIYHTNDMHGRGAALRWLEEHALEQSERLLLDSGDAISGSNTVFRRYEDNLAAMSRLGYTAMAMGNREFNYLRSVQRMRERQRNFPCLCANLEDLASPIHYFAPYYEMEVPVAAGPALRLGLTGATPVQYPISSPWEALFRFRFLDPLGVVPALAQALAARCDLVIVLSHLGLEVDRLLAPSLPAGTLILGGHTHTRLDEPLDCGRGRFIFQTGAFARSVGRLQLDLERATSSWQVRLHNFALFDTGGANR